MGLSEGIIAACFNQLYKMNPETISLWFNLLDKTRASQAFSIPFSTAAQHQQLHGHQATRPLSVSLWLILFESQAEEHIRREARVRGVSQDRLLLTPPLPPHAHLTGKAVADLFLDTPAFNAHSTLADVLHGGVPAVTTPQIKMASRVASSILAGARLESMIARDWADYLEMASRLLSRPQSLAAWRARTAAASEVFDVGKWMLRWEKCVALLYDSSSSSSSSARFGRDSNRHVITS